MRKNQQAFKRNTYIPLLNENENINLTEKSIQDFICYCQNQVISINNQNAIPLNRLAQKYEIIQLIDSSKQYIIEHHNELLFEIYSENLNINFSDNFDYENAISDHILDYISNGKLITLPLSSIYRIISQNANNNIIEIYNFLLDCLNKYDKAASVLFTCIDLDKAPTNYIKQLLTEYADKIDLTMSKPTF